MNRVFQLMRPLALVVALAVAGVPAFTAAQTERSQSATVAVKRVVVPFLRGLKQGNLKKMRPRMSADLYARYRVLFEQNREYPKYLLDFYRDVTFSVGGISVTDGEAIADVDVAWRDGRSGTVHIGLTLDRHDRWKVSRFSD